MSKPNSQIIRKQLPLIITFCFIFLSLSMGMPLDGLSAVNNRESPIVKAVRKVSPAVVNISSAYEVRKRANPFSGFGFDSFFDQFFQDFVDPRFEQRQRHTSLGSGVIIDGKRGLILTNAHVLARTGTITVVLEDEREFDAQIVGADPDSDLAVLKIDSTEKLPAIEMGDSDDLMIGETVIAIGNPFGFSHTVTTGVISAVDRSIRTDDRIYHQFIQIDASINPGNSGGPLLNINGDLIGVNTAIYAKAQGIGFAIPISKAKKIVSDLIQYGEVIQAWVGITIQNLETRVAQYLKFPGKKGIIVKAVEPQSPADRAGLREGDIIVSIENKKMTSTTDYHSATKTLPAGDVIEAHIWRNGKKHTFAIKTMVFPMEQADELALRLLGVQVKDLSEKIRRKFQTNASKGVVISEIETSSYLAQIGARAGDVIRKIDDYDISNREDFKKAVIKYRQKSSVVLLLQRGDQGYYITVNL